MRRIARVITLSAFTIGLFAASDARQGVARTISSAEASRLTFAALTAPPRAAVRSTRRSRGGYRRGLVVSASYLHKASRKGAKAHFLRSASHRHGGKTHKPAGHSAHHRG